MHNAILNSSTHIAAQEKKKNNTDEMMSEGKSPMKENLPSEVHSHEKVRKCYVQDNLGYIFVKANSSANIFRQCLDRQRMVFLYSAWSAVHVFE